MIKLQTLIDGADKKTSYANEETYTNHGKFLRKYKLDEFPQVWNWLKGDMSLVGPRPEEQKTLDIIPEETRKILLSVKPGLTSLSSVYFFEEEKLLQQFSDPSRVYWSYVKPMKIFLDTFYIQNKCFSLDVWILWATFKRLIKTLWKD